MTTAANRVFGPGDWIALGGLAVAMFTVWWTGKQAERTRVASERTSRQREAALVLGPVLALLSDADPRRVGMNAGPQTDAVLTEMWDRWIGRLREPLLSIAAAYASDEERRLGRALATEMNNLIMSVSHWARSLPGEQRPFTLELVQGHHDAASALADQLAARLRGERPAADAPAAT